MRFPLIGLIVVLTAPLVAPAPAAQTPGGDRLLDTVVLRAADLQSPPTSRNIGHTLAALAKSTGVLIGFETVMDDPPPVQGTSEVRVSGVTRRLTLAQALDHIVAKDPRYAWREHQGVIHVRPQTAFGDGGHFLNQRVARFQLEHAVPLHATFEVHRIYRPDCRIQHSIYTNQREAFLSSESPSLSKPISVSLTNVSVLEILDAVVKAHGQLYWNVTFQVPPGAGKPDSAKYEHAVFGFHDTPAVGGWWRMCAGG